MSAGGCHCFTCGERFSSLFLFDAHRVGNWLDSGANRRCLTVDEMAASRMFQLEAGSWKQRKPSASAVAEGRFSGDLLQGGTQV